MIKTKIKFILRIQSDSNQLVENESSERVASLYLSQVLNFIQYINIIYIIKISQSKIDSTTNSIFEFISGNVLSLTSFDCLLPST